MKAKIRNAMVVEQPAYPGVGRLGSHAESGLHGRPAKRGENGTLHTVCHPVVALRSFAAIKKDLPLAHFEEVRSWAAAVQYCQKGGL